MKKVIIVDYGTSNLKSLVNALEHIKAVPVITRDKNTIIKAKKIIIPGVGAFNHAMENLIKLELIDSIKEAAEKGTPLLGICLGMQILFSRGFENKVCKGLDLICGDAVRFSSGIKIPHMGWNTLKIIKVNPLLKNVAEDDYFYFVHSYVVTPENNENILALTEYGSNFCSAVSQENTFGVQFHPEKSHKSGLRILDNFIRI